MLVGWFADRVALWLDRRNGGICEPEHRLWILVVSGVIASVGLILWGVGVAKGVHFMGLIFGVGMTSFSIVVGGSTFCHTTLIVSKRLLVKRLFFVIVIRNSMGFGFSYAITP